MNKISLLSLIDTLSSLGVSRSLRDIERKINEMIVLEQSLVTGSVVNVSEFGAKGDGIADDTAPINEAITAAGPGGKVDLLVGRYRTKSTIGVGHSVVIEGRNRDGSIIVPDHASAAFDVGANEVTFSRVGIDCSGSTRAANCLVVSANALGFVASECQFIESAQWPVLFESNCGLYGRVEGSRLYCHAPGASLSSLPPYAGIKIMDDGTPMYRKILTCDNAPFHNLLDNEGEMTIVFANSTFNLDIRAACDKGLYIGNRVASVSTPINVYGLANIFSLNMCGGSPTIKSTAVNCLVGPNIGPQAVDESPLGQNFLIHAMIGEDVLLGRERSGSHTYSATETIGATDVSSPFDIPLPGALPADTVEVSFEPASGSGPLRPLLVNAAVEAPDTGRVWFTNPTGSSHVRPLGTVFLRSRRR